MHHAELNAQCRSVLHFSLLLLINSSDVHDVIAPEGRKGGGGGGGGGYGSVFIPSFFLFSPYQHFSKITSHVAFNKLLCVCKLNQRREKEI